MYKLQPSLPLQQTVILFKFSISLICFFSFIWSSERGKHFEIRRNIAGLCLVFRFESFYVKKVESLIVEKKKVDIFLNGSGSGERGRMMKKSFKDSLKALEADIQHANTLASDYSSECDGACLQMRLSYSPCANIFMFLVQWADCHLASALGLIRILIYKAYKDGKTTMSVHERKATLREFYGVIFPSLLQLHRGITDVEERKQREICATKYKRRDEMEKGKLSEIEIEREEECGICMEMTTKVVLPNCSHSLCTKCYKNWRARSQSCPFCRDSLKRVNSGELWIYTSTCDIVDLSAIARENIKRLLIYIDKLPLAVPDPMMVSYYPHFR